MRQAVEGRWFPGWSAGQVLQRRLPDGCASRTAPDSTGDRGSLTGHPRRTGIYERGIVWLLAASHNARLSAVTYASVQVSVYVGQAFMRNELRTMLWRRRLVCMRPR